MNYHNCNLTLEWAIAFAHSLQPLEHRPFELELLGRFLALLLEPRVGREPLGLTGRHHSSQLLERLRVHRLHSQRDTTRCRPLNFRLRHTDADTKWRRRWVPAASRDAHAASPHRPRCGATCSPIARVSREALLHLLEQWVCDGDGESLGHVMSKLFTSKCEEIFYMQMKSIPTLAIAFKRSRWDTCSFALASNFSNFFLALQHTIKKLWIQSILKM